MKYALIFLLPFAAAASDLTPQQIFSRPLILGASVSYGFMTTGPGTRAASRYTAPANILNLARAGSYGRDQIHQLTPQNLEGRTIVIAIDIMFWDSWAAQTAATTYEKDVAASEDALWKLISTTAAHHIPLVIGDIPLAEFNGAQQPAEMQLNLDIRTWCLQKNGCYILPLKEIVESASSKGIMINGKLAHLKDITTDGFHLKASMSEHLADLIVRMVTPQTQPAPRTSGPAESDLGFSDEIRFLLQHGLPPH